MRTVSTTTATILVASTIALMLGACAESAPVTAPESAPTSGTIAAALTDAQSSGRTVLLRNNVTTNRCMDVNGAVRTAGAPLIIWSCTGAPNQLFTWNTARELRVYGTMCVDAANNTGRDGDPIIIWTCNGGANQKWTATAAGEIKGISGKCIATRYGSSALETRLVLGTCNGSASQRWSEQYVGGAPTATVAAVSVTPTLDSLEIGAQRQLAATARDANGNVINGQTVTWTSSASSIASVSTAGLVSALAAGTAVVTATVGDRSATATIVVRAAAPRTVSVSIRTASLLVGDTATAVAQVSGGSASTLSSVSWSSSNTAVATVSSTGLVRAIAAGSATIRATSDAVTGSVGVNVSAPATQQAPAGAGPAPTSSSTILVNENFDRFTGVKSGSPAVASIYPIGGNPSLVGGRNGSTRAVRFPYTTSNIANSLEAYFTSSTDLYVSYWFRTSPGADPTAGGRNPSGIKWFMAWRSDDGMQPRYTMGVGNLTGGPAGKTNSGLEFSARDQGSRLQPDPFVQNIRKDIKYGTVNDGQWHKYTVHIVTGTGGYEQIWIDDQLVLDSRGYGYDHPSMGIRIISFPGNVVPDVPAGWEFTIDVDDLVVWRP